MSAPEVKLSDVLGPVQSDLERMRSIIVEQLTDHSASVRDMTDHISRFRGKQLRGALVLLGSIAAAYALGRSGSDEESVQASSDVVAPDAAPLGAAAPPQPKALRLDWDDGWDPLPGEDSAIPVETRELYSFIGHHPEIASYMPCFCGCGQRGHKSVESCFVQERDATGKPWRFIGPNIHRLFRYVPADGRIAVDGSITQRHTNEYFHPTPFASCKITAEKRGGGPLDLSAVTAMRMVVSGDANDVN